MEQPQWQPEESVSQPPSGRPTGSVPGRDDAYGTGALILGVLAAIGFFVIGGWAVLLAFVGSWLAQAGHRKLAAGTATNRGVVMIAGIVNGVVVAVVALLFLAGLAGI